MLTHLSVRNFVVVKSLDIDLQGGLTAITGETGAGKSIAIDAIGLCLGERADANLVRTGASKAEVSASFSLAATSEANHWLTEQHLDAEGECVIRRVISSEGRSKAYINGSSVTLQQLKSLGQFLVNIHGQHAHHQLRKPEQQRQLLDLYIHQPELLTATADSYQHWQQIKRELQQFRTRQQQRQDRRNLLEYQVQELDDFALQDGEFQALESEHKRLSHSQTLLEQTQLSFHQLYDDEQFNALAAVQHSLDSLQALQSHDPALTPIVTLLNEASINIDEAAQELRSYTESLEIDPLRMQQVEQRYSQALELARKHQVTPEALYDLHQNLASEYQTLKLDQNTLAELETNCEQAHNAYLQASKTLSQCRQQQGKKLASAIEQEIQQMNMPHAQFTIEVQHNTQAPASAHGLDEVQFKVATNPGQQPDSLDKVASGGELSRIGLAMQVLGSRNQAIPAMIFDEVDTGISGPTAAIVGKLLRRLGKQAQVICVTHLPQVAACAHQQLFVSKQSDGNSTQTQMFCLQPGERIEELARLLAGDTLTPSAIANAKALLAEHHAA